MMVSAGGQDTGDGSFEIKVPGLFENIEDVLNTPIKTSGDSVITFKDIASIKRTFEDRQSYANVNGSNSVTIQVSKRIGENIIQTIDEVKKKLYLLLPLIFHPMFKYFIVKINLRALR